LVDDFTVTLFYWRYIKSQKNTEKLVNLEIFYITLKLFYGNLYPESLTQSF